MNEAEATRLDEAEAAEARVPLFADDNVDRRERRGSEFCADPHSARIGTTGLATQWGLGFIGWLVVQRVICQRLKEGDDCGLFFGC